MIFFACFILFELLVCVRVFFCLKLDNNSKIIFSAKKKRYVEEKRRKKERRLDEKMIVYKSLTVCVLTSVSCKFLNFLILLGFVVKDMILIYQ